MLSDKVKLLGRTTEVDGRLLLKDSYTGISFYCRGGIKFTLTPVMDSDKDSCPYIGVVIDDNITDVTKIAVTNGLKKIDIVKGDGNIHKIEIVKLTEEQYGNLWFSELEFEDEASVSAAETLDRSILFIGDSITAGYGVNGVDGEGDFTTSEENILDSAAVLTARKLNAEVFVFANSGDGIISRWVEPGTDIPNTNALIPAIFPFEGDIFPAPDYIVINLGTNDTSYINGVEERKKLFENEYIKFIINLRKLYPLAGIIVAYGIMDTELNPVIRGLTDRYKKVNNDNNCEFVELEKQNTREGIGALGHPGMGVNKRVSDTLAKAIIK